MLQLLPVCAFAGSSVINMPEWQSVKGSAICRHQAGDIDGAICEMLKAIVRMFETRQPPIPAIEMREIVAFIESANNSAATGGHVPLA